MEGQVGARSAPACRGCGLPPWRLTRKPPTPYTPAQLAAVFSQFRLFRSLGKTPPIPLGLLIFPEDLSRNPLVKPDHIQSRCLCRRALSRVGGYEFVGSPDEGACDLNRVGCAKSMPLQ